ncbi:MAG: 30S ribosomal protein S6 [Candidatus Gracilibacteria bacterium]|jgi:small subunit ribosomal protein S6
MKYELMVILSPKYTDKETEKMLKEIKESVTEHKFELVDEDIWGIRDLAYRMKGQDRGYYAILNFTGEAKGIGVLEKDLGLQQGVLRHLLIKVPDSYTLLRYEGEVMMAKTANGRTGTAGPALSNPAEELDKKVRTKKPKAEKSTEREDNKLDEKLKAIIEDKDII